MVYLDGSGVRMLTRNDREVASTYPELRGWATTHCARAVRCWTARSSPSTRAGAPASGSCRRACTCSSRRRRCSPRCRSPCWSSTCAVSPASRCCGCPTTTGAPCSRPSAWTGRTGRRRPPSTETARPPSTRRAARASRACSPSGATRSTSRASGRGRGSRSSTSACRRSSSAAGSPGAAGARAASARCCSGCTTTRVGWSTPATWARASPSGCSTTCWRGCDRSSGRPRRWPRRCRGRRSRMPVG